MSKSKKAVIVASIFIVVGVIIVFLSFAINQMVLSTCSV